MRRRSRTIPPRVAEDLATPRRNKFAAEMGKWSSKATKQVRECRGCGYEGEQRQCPKCGGWKWERVNVGDGVVNEEVNV